MKSTHTGPLTRLLPTLALTLAALCAQPAARAEALSFDTAVSTASGQAAGVWYTDRYAPAGFATTVFDGDNRLVETIAAADGLNNRDAIYSSSFYNTQGRKYDVADTTTLISADLYISDSWATTGRRMAGLWGTGFDATGAVSSYTIFDFYSNGSTGAFRAYNSNTGAWIDLGLPSSFSYNSWVTLSAAIVGDSIVYTVGDKTVSVDANGTTYVGNVMLQGYNTTTGVSYSIYWDNVTAVPEPAGWAMLAGGLLGIGLLARRNTRTQAITA